MKSFFHDYKYKCKTYSVFCPHFSKTKYHAVMVNLSLVHL